MVLGESGSCACCNREIRPSDEALLFQQVSSYSIPGLFGITIVGYLSGRIQDESGGDTMVLVTKRGNVVATRPAEEAASSQTSIFLDAVVPWYVY